MLEAGCYAVVDIDYVVIHDVVVADTDVVVVDTVVVAGVDVVVDEQSCAC